MPDHRSLQKSGAASAALIPVGQWIRFEVEELSVVGFTYLDPDAGFSAQGSKIQGASLDQSQRMIVRLPIPGVSWRPLELAEIRAFNLEERPEFVAHYGPQPAAGTLWGAWREHPQLQGRFLPEHPDDLQVLVHDGGPRLTRSQPEAVWVSMRAMEGNVFRGRVLNQPHQLHSVKQHDEIKFVAAGGELPVMVTDKYLRERGEWNIQPCRKCGLAELFDAPSDLLRVVFPDLPPGSNVDVFSSFCPLCGDVQVVESRSRPPEKRPWWKFW